MGFDTPYIIGIIRAEEMKLLQEDEYTRIIEAPTLQEAVHVLVDTSYGKWMNPTAEADVAERAIEERLVRLKTWLDEMITDERVLQFYQARYDGLNAAAAILDKMSGQTAPQTLSRLGSVLPETWQSVIWDEVGWEALPKNWQDYVHQMLTLDPDAPESTKTVMDEAEAVVLKTMKANAKTPLSHTVLRWYQDRLECDREIRQSSDKIGMSQTLVAWQERYPALTREAIEQVQMQQSSADYERAWDIELMRLVRPYQYEPVGYDSIMAFWYAVEMEAKSVRLLVTARAQGLESEAITNLRRPLYLQTA